MNQEMVYNSVGKKIKADLYEGNAVVLFAYGLSGSGKTFTVFGPDAVDIPEVCLSAGVCVGVGSVVWLLGVPTPRVTYIQRLGVERRCQ